MYKFQSRTCETVGEKLRTKLCPQTDRQMDGRTAMAIPVYSLHFVVGDIKMFYYYYLDGAGFEQHETNAGDQHFLLLTKFSLLKFSSFQKDMSKCLFNLLEVFLFNPFPTTLGFYVSAVQYF